MTSFLQTISFTSAIFTSATPTNSTIITSVACIIVVTISGAVFYFCGKQQDDTKHCFLEAFIESLPVGTHFYINFLGKETQEIAVFNLVLMDENGKSYKWHLLRDNSGFKKFKNGSFIVVPDEASSSGKGIESWERPTQRQRRDPR